MTGEKGSVGPQGTIGQTGAQGPKGQKGVVYTCCPTYYDDASPICEPCSFQYSTPEELSGLVTAGWMRILQQGSSSRYYYFPCWTF
jgi:hypothetical protein